MVASHKVLPLCKCKLLQNWFKESSLVGFMGNTWVSEKLAFIHFAC